MMAQMINGQLGAEGPYWDALAQGRLMLPRCDGCGKWHWPAVWRCGACGSWDHAWHEQPLAGTVFTWTRTHHRFAGTEGLDRPYATALVLLDAVPIRLNGLIEGRDYAVRLAGGTGPRAAAMVAAINSALVHGRAAS